MDLARKWRQANLETVLKDGLNLTTTEPSRQSPPPRFRCVMDYHRIYKSKAATPVQVISNAGSKGPNSTCSTSASFPTPLQI
jgi:hypothetical protein